MAIVRHRRAIGADTYQPTPPKKSPEELRSFARDNDIPVQPLDVARLASALGLTLVYEPMDDDISGYLEKRSAGWVVGVNSFQHRRRQRFTIAHELAHYFLHSHEQSEFTDVVLMQRTARRDPRELAADEFAGELIIPTEEFNKRVKGGETKLSNLSEYFDVSMMAVKYKASLLGYRIRSE
jgi:Zn-dependent peptidase ImmA (M78 family)